MTRGIEVRSQRTAAGAHSEVPADLDSHQFNTSTPRERVELFRRLLADVGQPLRESTVVLDFGCGNGELVAAFLDAGFSTFGTDFATAIPNTTDRLRALVERPYHIPFEDDSFDCVVSDQVFEHVQNYGEAFREIRRVLRPGRVALHLFPPRYTLREPHTYVPLATVIQSRAWLLFWARIGIRNEHQQHKSASEVAALNYEYLKHQTTYYRRREVLGQARRAFPNARFLERELLATRPGRRARTMARAAHHLPALAAFWCETRGRALLLAR